MMFGVNDTLINRICSIAYTICPTNREMRSSHVAFLLKRSKIVHIGWNKCKTHPYNLRHPYHDGTTYRHAELDVLFKSGKEFLYGYKLIVIRIDRNGKICNSRPCRGCQSVIKQFGIDEVWHSNANGSIIQMI